MQSNPDTLYKLTSLRTGQDKETYTDIGTFVFAKVNKSLSRPKTLIIKLKGVGCWYLRRLRLQTMVDLFPPSMDGPSNPDLRQNVFKYENRIELYALFLDRLKDYDRYIEKKKMIRDLRNKTQYLLPHDTSSEDNS